MRVPEMRLDRADSLRLARSLGGGFKDFLFFFPKPCGNDPICTIHNIFQMG